MINWVSHLGQMVPQLTTFRIEGWVLSPSVRYDVAYKNYPKLDRLLPKAKSSTSLATILLSTQVAAVGLNVSNWIVSTLPTYDGLRYISYHRTARTRLGTYLVCVGVLHCEQYRCHHISHHPAYQR